MSGLSPKPADDPAFNEIGWQVPGTPAGLFTKADIIGCWAGCRRDQRRRAAAVRRVGSL